jgi:hypothetical protein
MSIKAQIEFFEELIDGDLKSFREELHKTNEVTVELPLPSAAVDIIKNSLIKYLKRTKFLQEAYRVARTDKFDSKGRRTEKAGEMYPKNPYQISDTETDTQLVDAINKVPYSKIASKIFNDRMASKYYTNEFGVPIDFRGGEATFIEAEGTGYEFKSGNRARRSFRQKAEREMVKACIILSLRSIAKALRKAGASDRIGRRGKGEKISLTGASGVEVGRYKRTGDKTTPNLPESRDMGFDIVGAHQEATTALMHVAVKAAQAINEEALFNVLPKHDLGGIALDTRTKLREHFLEMEIENQTIDNYIKNDTLNKVNVRIRLATHKENSQVNERDKNQMVKFLKKLEEDAMSDLTTRFGSQEGSQAYLDTAASKKTLRKRMDDAVVDKINDGIADNIKKSKTTKVTKPKTKSDIKNKKTKGKKKINITKSKGIKKIKAPKISKEALVVGAKTGRSKTIPKMTKMAAKNPLALANMLNKALPKAVAERMVSPALVYRTGRFANSAEITDVTVGPRGGTFIDYTYQLDPYQTFEPGFQQGSTNRDPRRLIGGTIRGLAQTIMNKRFVNVRRR